MNRATSRWRCAHRFGEGRVGDVADQDVLEGQLALARELARELARSRRDDDVLLLQARQRARQLPWRRKRAQQARPEGAPDDRRLLYEAALERVERVEPGGKDRLDAAGQARQLGDALFGDAAHHLLGEERIALRAPGDRLGERAAARDLLQQARHERVRVVLVERLQDDRRCVEAPAGPATPAVQKLVASQAEHEHGATHPLGDVLAEVEHPRIRPVDVLEGEHERRPPADRLDERAHRGERPLAQLLGAAVPELQPCRRLDAQQPGDRRRGSLSRLARGVAVREQACGRRGELGPGDVRAVRGADRALGVDHLAQRPVDDPRSIGQAVPAAHRSRGRAALSHNGELLEQARLADAASPITVTRCGR